jgi:hypothetical protein
MEARQSGRYRVKAVIDGNSTEPGPVRHWLLVQLTLAATGWAVIAFGISCFV